MYKGTYQTKGPNGTPYTYMIGDSVLFQGKLYTALNQTQKSPLQSPKDWKYSGLTEPVQGSSSPLLPEPNQFWVDQSNNLYIRKDITSASWQQISGGTGGGGSSGGGISGPYVISFNGLTGAVTGVNSINGSTGTITNVALTNTGNTWSGYQDFGANEISAFSVRVFTLSSSSSSATPGIIEINDNDNNYPVQSGFKVIYKAGSEDTYSTIVKINEVSDNTTVLLPTESGTIALTKNVVNSVNGLTGTVQYITDFKRGWFLS